MNACWRFLDDSWPWLVILACAGGAEWIAGLLEAVLPAAGIRRARKLERREELRGLGLESLRRGLEPSHPLPVVHVCDCRPDISSHTVQTSTCYHQADGKRCRCQCYASPEDVSVVCLAANSQRDRGTSGIHADT